MVSCFGRAKASKVSLFHGMQEDSVKHWLRTVLDSMMNVVKDVSLFKLWICTALLSICERPACARAESLSDHASADLGGIEI